MYNLTVGSGAAMFTVNHCIKLVYLCSLPNLAMKWPIRAVAISITHDLRQPDFECTKFDTETCTAEAGVRIFLYRLHQLKKIKKVQYGSFKNI